MPTDSDKVERTLTVERLTQEIWDRVLELHELNDNRFGEYLMPDPNKVLYSGAVTNNGKLVAVGTVPLLAEAIIEVDPNQSVRNRLEAISLLLDEFKIGVQHMDGLHAFIQDPNFSSILQRRFGFRKCKGEALYMEL